jgi:hypothetical protein
VITLIVKEYYIAQLCMNCLSRNSPSGRSLVRMKPLSPIRLSNIFWRSAAERLSGVPGAFGDYIRNVERGQRMSSEGRYPSARSPYV